MRFYHITEVYQKTAPVSLNIVCVLFNVQTMRKLFQFDFSIIFTSILVWTINHLVTTSIQLSMTFVLLNRWRLHSQFQMYNQFRQLNICVEHLTLYSMHKIHTFYTVHSYLYVIILDMLVSQLLFYQNSCCCCDNTENAP